MEESKSKRGKLLTEKFNKLKSVADIASLLDFSKSKIKYYSSEKNESTEYETFKIKKKNGKDRRIDSPNPGLQEVQNQLREVLYAVYEPKVVTHGFCKDRSVVTNAEPHVGQAYVLNIDIKDFFPSITFPRIKGLLTSWPYKIGIEAASVIAGLCCFRGKLPQGAPTSPIISNMLCGRLDTKLRKIAKSSRCTCTRYADDITFSTSLSSFPRSLAYYDEAGQLHIGHRLGGLISDEGFELNKDKLRLQHADQRQEVTGLVVNEKVNVKREYLREVRAMLHAWDKHGYVNAQSKFHQEYDTKRRAFGGKPSYRKVLRGKIGYIGRVRGRDDPVYRKMMRKLAEIDPKTQYYKKIPLTREVKIYVRTEGKTDWKHIKTAFKHSNPQKRYEGLTLSFEEFEHTRGHGTLKQKIEQSEGPPDGSDIELFLFDSDTQGVNQEMSGDEKYYTDQGRDKFSAILPNLEHRSGGVCIEHYYSDGDMKQFGEEGNREGRRLFTKSDFDQGSSLCKFDKNIKLTKNWKLKEERAPESIIDEGVSDLKNGNSVAMSKSDFAEMVVEHPERFDFSHFTVLFDMIHDLAADWLDS